MSLLTDASLLLTPNAYKSTKLYSIIPSNGNGDFTFSRATTATRVNAAGLNELLYYNTYQYSEMFADALWIKTSTSITANTQTAPNGTLTADTLSIGIDGASVRHRLAQTVGSAITNLTVTGTYYLKAAQHQWIQLCAVSAQFPADIWANFNLSTGTIGNTGAGTTASIENVGNGWYRCRVTGTQTTAGSTTAIEVVTTNNTDSIRYPSYQSLVAEDVCYIWGAQYVDGALPLNYQRTELRLNVPRIDYSLGSCPNILLEPIRTNLCLWSEEFNNAVWTVTGISIDANVTTAPNGVLTAEKIKVNSGQAVGSSHIQQIITKAASALIYSCSAYLKASELNSARLFVRDSISALNNANAQFNLSTGVISVAATANGTFSSASATITNVGNGWYRCTLNFTSSTDTVLQFRIGTADTTITTGNGIDGIFGWGAQLELGQSNISFATSYIPTTSATVTRNFESFTRNNIYTNGLISASGGTWFVELRNNIAYQRQGGYPTIYIANSTNGSTGNVIGFGSTLGAARLNLYYFQNSGSQQLIGTPAANTIKVAFVWTPTTLKVFVNGSVFGSYTGLTWDITTFQFLLVRGEVPINLNEMALFPTPLTDPQCIALTT
jgi:hypothetical protein